MLYLNRSVYISDTLGQRDRLDPFARGNSILKKELYVVISGNRKIKISKGRMIL